ncbi:MAG: sigma-70 family RNA polymerase sigma factor [Chitinophagaceae bacterium]|nr:sigma-70 family RNA polymerase sigma factor [Chitinophagaceae bacterium]
MTKLNVIDPQQWVDNHADYLYSYALSRLDDEEQARDLVQETFLAALERVDQFEGRSSERTWLTAILKNKVMDVFRRKSMAFETVVNHADDVDFFDAGNGHWKEEYQPRSFGIENYDHVVNKEFNIVLENCMKKLPALWLSVFTMRHIEELAADVICNHLKVTSSNFWVIIHRTKVNLRACLQKNW